MELRPAFSREDATPPTRPADAPYDLALRPKRLAEFIGQGPVVANLRLSIDAAKSRGEPIDHVLLSGLPGLGKTTLAEILALEMGSTCRTTAGPAIEKPGDLAGLLTSLGRNDVLFIDEIHRLPTHVEEYLYSAMEDFRLVIMLDQGPRARAVPLQLHPFTLVGATTREGLLSEPFRARFGIHERLEPYEAKLIAEMVARSAGLLGLAIDEGAADLVASCSRGTPRLANRFLRRLRDHADVAGSKTITMAMADAGLARLGLDENGLLALDRKFLLLLERAQDRPMGLKTLAVALGEEERTIEDVYEPYLIREGLVAKTPRGRVITPSGRELLTRAGRPSKDAP